LLYRWFGVLHCPQCHDHFSMIANGEMRALQCRQCCQRYPVAHGIARLLKPERVDALEKFCARYDALRLQEGWASENPEFYLHLPCRDLSGRHEQEWRLRAKSFQLVHTWLAKFAAGRMLRILEVGAGSGWMSQKLAVHHHVLACDVNAGRHGLCATPSAQRRFMAVQAELDCLPLAEHSLDVIIANASLHYTAGPENFFEQAHRVLRPNGKLIVMDSPVYPDEPALAAARQRTRTYYAHAGFPELAQNYNGLTTALFENGSYFLFSRLRRDLNDWVSIQKYLREKLGQEAAARFPVWIGAAVNSAGENWQPGPTRAGALIIQNGKLLTYRFRGDQPYWRIPGGGVEKGETPEQAAQRELREEAGLDIALQQRFGPYFLSNKNHWYFLAEAKGQGLPEENAGGVEEACVVNWLPLQKLAQFDIRPAGLKWELVECLRC
jgi:8-oxo-dGTP pyrophosphatase MutT (NUDIX family)/ubiquinone/menaquinone biosynthesis C-methylase UbiE/uncharacterized protein YbaR (Trm112 family)